MIRKSIDIQDTREIVGWAYQDMKWLTNAEAGQARQKRDTLLQALSGKVHSRFLDNKIGPGSLSPGCMSCGQGTWSCIFIDCLCTANCFYCPQDRKNREEKPPTESGLIFDSAEDYADYLQKFKFKGASFSGGEPFLAYEKVLTYTRKIRERLGPDIYIWMYTNGDLVDKKKLVALKEAGLNEIRFDIAARHYDLKALKKAIGIIDTVSVEIPAIPEDYEILKRCLPRLKAIGVAHLNLHQLFPTQHCYRRLTNRRYTFLHQPTIPVLESEMTALRIIQYATDKNIGLPINYCCSIYKHRFQQTGYRKRFLPYVQEPYETSTESGFIRRLKVQDTPTRLRKLLKILRDQQCPERLWQYNPNCSEVAFHPSLLKHVDFSRHSLTVSYFAPQLITDEVPEEQEDRAVREIALNTGRSIFLERKFVHEMKISNSASIECFRNLFIKKIDNGKAFQKFYRDYPLKIKADIDTMMTEKDRLDYLKSWEFIGRGLHPIY